MTGRAGGVLLLWSLNIGGDTTTTLALQVWVVCAREGRENEERTKKGEGEGVRGAAR